MYLSNIKTAQLKNLRIMIYRVIYKIETDSA